MDGRIGRIFAGIFAAFGLVVFAAIVSQLIAGLFMERNVCENALFKKSPSPDGLLEVSVKFTNCTQDGAKTEVLLYKKSDPSSAAILVSITGQADAGDVYPAPILTTWRGEKRLEIRLPSEHLPYRGEREDYGASVRYTAIDG